MKDKILIVGASGTVGRELTRLLKESGYGVRATTSKQVQPTNELVTLQLATGEGLRDAFAGVDRAFLLSPPGYVDQYRLLSPLIQEAKRRGLKRVVLMTALGANADESSPFRKAEVELEKSGLGFNIIRPNWFLQNFNTNWLKDIREKSQILLPTGSAKVSFIDARDISAVAAKLLTSEEFSNKAFDLTGPEAVDHTQVAAAISKAVGREIRYQEIKPEVLHQNLVSMGLPGDYVDFLITILGYLRQGYNSTVNGNVKLLLGTEPRGLQDYVSAYKQKWL